MADEQELEKLTFTEIKKLKVADLKSNLSHLGLPVTGLKADLVARLASYLESKALQEALIARSEEESEAHASSAVFVETGIRKDATVAVNIDDDTNAKPEDGNVLCVPKQVSEVTSEVVAGLIADVETIESDIPANMGIDETEHVSQSFMETGEEFAKQKPASPGVEIVEVKDSDAVQETVKAEEKEPVIEVETQHERKAPEVEQEDKKVETNEEKRAEQGFKSQPTETEVEIEPQVASNEPETDEIALKETALVQEEMEHTGMLVEEDQIMVEHGKVQHENTEEIGREIVAASSVDMDSMYNQLKENDKPQPTDEDQRDLQEDVKNDFPAVVEPESSIKEPVSDSTAGLLVQKLPQTEESSSPVDEMQTETIKITPQSSVTKEQAETNESVEKKQPSEELSSEEPLQPSFELPEETLPLEPRPSSPSQFLPHPSLQPPTQVPNSASQFPTHQVSKLLSDTPAQAPLHPQFEDFPQEQTLFNQPPFSPSHQTFPTQPQIHHSIPSTPPSQILPEPVIETEHATPRKASTPPKETPKIDAPLPEEVSLGGTPPNKPMPQLGTPQDDTPPRVTPPRGTPPTNTSTQPNPPSPRQTVPPSRSPMDAISEATKKARSVVEMRERRSKEDSQIGARGDDSGYDVDHYEQEGVPAGESQQEKKKKKKKKRKKRNNEQPKVQSEAAVEDEGIEVEYVAETLDVKDPVYAQFAKIFETFKLTDKPETAKKDEPKEKPADKTAEAAKKDEDEVESDTDSEEEETQKKEEQAGEKVEKLSKKKLKLKNRMSVAELKQTVHRPDVVEMHDVTAPDPKLLVYLKACRNTVPVPRHWCFKRKFLQGKRGIIKPPFQLPEFIQKTGIMEMREALQEKEDAKNMKAKMREKIRPKMGKIDIDYQKLHDAFFKWQTKPKMSIHGDLYYEGKEFETKLKEKKPGDLSDDLRTALGMPTGQGSNLVPPPWLIAMQRYGPPPSYPNLKIRGLNAPIPEGASFGYHAGGWGKPPVDEHGRPLYGDVFGVLQTDVNIVDDEQVDSNLWGELESESEESEESEEESEEEAPDQSGLVTPAETGLVTPSGLTSIPAGMETPDMIELRKRKNIEDAMESGSEQPTLYTVLPEKRVGVGAMMMGSSHVYDLATAAPTGTRKTPGGLSEGVEVALDPSELELDPAAMQARYDEQLREQQNTQKEDFSDMVAEHAARQQKKRKKTTDSGKAAKKYKEFKF